MFYVIGLGNPGKAHEGTRHNVGFMLAEAFIAGAGLPSLHESGKYSGRISEGMFENEEVTVLLPSTFMNVSGSAVQKLVPKDEIGKLLVIYDDIDLPIGEIKISYGRGDGGHNGMKSIIEKLGTNEFTRLRVGIAQKSMWTGKLKRPKGQALADFVLGTFSASEQKKITELGDITKEVIATFVSKGREVVMNTFN